MGVNDVAAAYIGLKQTLDGGGLWNGRAYADMAPPGVVRPYVVFFLMAGADARATQQDASALRIGVKCIANTMAEAADGAEHIAQLLNDAERRDGLAIGSGWVLIHCTRGLTIHLVELIDGQTVYHMGNQYRLLIERTENG